MELQRKVLIIGGTGHIGSNLLHILCEKNYGCRVLVRPNSLLTGIKNLPVEIIKGSIFQTSDLINAMEDCDSVFHLASPTFIIKGMERDIVEGTKNIIFAAKQVGIRRLLYTSSIVTIGFSNSPERILTEKDDCFINASPYHFSKREAEKLVLEAGERGNLETIVVNPGTVIGPGDYRTTVSSTPISQGMHKPLRFWFDAGVTISYVKSVADGHRLALEKGKSGERYILGGEPITIKNYFSTINLLNGFSPPKIKLPGICIMGAGIIFSCSQKLGYVKVPFDFKRARALVGKYGYYSSEKAQKELGYMPVSAENAIKSYIEWKSHFKK